MKDFSTSKLKRYYWKMIRGQWKWARWPYQYILQHGPAGYERAIAHKSFCRERAFEAKTELQHRGYWLP